MNPPSTGLFPCLRTQLVCALRIEPPIDHDPIRRLHHMSILAWIVLGLIAGAIAKAIMPGRDPGGVIVTILIGIVGAFLGGFLGNMIAGTGLSGFSLWS